MNGSKIAEKKHFVSEMLEIPTISSSLGKLRRN
jgi:hypothetical protein